MRSSTRQLLIALLGALVLAGVLAGPAGAANLFTLDPAADSMGPVAVDAAGNGYVAWLHKSSTDTVMFCKLAADARSCPDPITLPAGGASPNTPCWGRAGTCTWLRRATTRTR